MKVKIPKYWTADQAEAVADFVAAVEFAIRKQYQVKILDHQLEKLNRQEQKSYQQNFEQKDF